MAIARSLDWIEDSKDDVTSKCFIKRYNVQLTDGIISAFILINLANLQYR